MILTEEEKIKLEKLVRSAGTELLKYWPGNEQPNKEQTGINLNIQKKSDGSSVTDADFASNQILLSSLQSSWPSYGIISEECADDPLNRTKEKVWIIDPLDGTKAFIMGRDDFSVLLGLSLNNSAYYGAMYFPKKDFYATGEQGKGAFLNNQPLKVSSSKILRPKSIYYRNFTPPENECFFQEWLDSGLAFLMLCRGEFDGMIIRMSSHKEWDIAAPSIIATESGGKVTDENGKEIKFNVGGIASKYVVASNGFLHDKLLEFIPK
jgi:myo-inositol-1(or 4)-monophosphatase